MKYLLGVLFFLFFLFLPSKILAVDTGGQLPSAETIKRLIPSQYGFQWLKYQYQLGTNLTALTNFIETAKSASRGRAGTGYKVLISIAKNNAGIETLKNPEYPEKTDDGHFVYTQKYCPWDNELDSYQKGTGVFVDCDAQGKNCTEETETIIQPAKSDNGYIKFRDLMQKLAPILQKADAKADAVEIWNEPNLAVEWSNPDPGQGSLGPVSPENYANFLICGIKGLKKGGYTGEIVTAGLAPLTGNTNGNMDDYQFFDGYFNYLSKNNQLNLIDALGWHSNVTADIPPTDTSDSGFQRVNHAIEKGKTVKKPIWVTEFGWQWNKLTPTKSYGGEREADQRHQQAQYVVGAYEVAKNLGNIEAMTVFNFGFYKETNKFQFEDIEGVAPEGLLCQPNTQLPSNKDYGDTSYVQDATLQDDATISAIVAKALIPQTVNQDVASKTGSKTEKTEIGVTLSFVDNLNQNLKRILRSFCNTIWGRIFGFANINFCKAPTKISIGLAEKEDNDAMVPGQNTATFSAIANVLGAISAPKEMKKIAESRDCNLGDDTNLINPNSGESRVNNTSTGLGTPGGFYGVDNPDFKTISSESKEVWEASMSARMIDENLNIGNKLFTQDRRSPDICLRLKEMLQGFFPSAVFPTNISCDDTAKILQEINNNQFKPNL